MSAPRRSTRIASMISESDRARAHIKTSLMNELDAVANEAFHAVRYTRQFLKACAYPDEATIEAIVWFTRLSWAIQDCNEYKTRQLFTNCDDTVLDSIPIVIQYLRTLTAETRKIDERFRPYERIPRTLVDLARTFASEIKDKLYHI